MNAIRFFLLPLFLCVTSSLYARPAIIEIDRIAAVVGNDAITISELQEQSRAAIARLQRQGTPLPPEDVLERQMLERMIIDRAQIQLAREYGMTVEEAELDQTIARIASRNNMSMDRFRSALEEDGISLASFREDIRNDILISRLRDREIDSRIVVSDAEIDNYLTHTRLDQGEFRVAHILFRTPEAASPDQLQRLGERAEQIRQRAIAGGNFAELVASYSDAPDALQGGDLGWRTLDDLPDIFADAVAGMRVNEISPLLQSANGFHILKLFERRGSSGQDDDDDDDDNNDDVGGVRQTHARHILIRTDEVVSEAEARRRLNDLRERISHGESFAELARLHSQDGSAFSGGDLGWINPGDTVPEFERVMDQLAEGEVSEVTQTPFGFHLIRVEARRLEDMRQERRRLAARHSIRERKLDEAYQDWLRQLRDRIYVEYRLEDE
ncbi:MAG: peptidylprolyl isomerase [Betaproteobacteria bacterium]|nr:peptidylprolyl isomerase [Betaproteobacteria bacterium]